MPECSIMFMLIHSMSECPSLMTHASVPDEQRALLGIDDTLIRLSVGIESCADLVADLNKALNAALQSLEPTFIPKCDVGEAADDEKGYWEW